MKTGGVNASVEFGWLPRDGMVISGDVTHGEYEMAQFRDMKVDILKGVCMISRRDAGGKVFEVRIQVTEATRC